MSIATLNDIFFATLERNLERVMLYRENGKWLPISAREFGHNVIRIAHALHAFLAMPPRVDLEGRKGSGAGHA